ncbi:MAG: HDIG domain-containing protein [Dehalococcoidales bacterium]|nr:MAG: HDIG domain-containing protein [Dehalococcoidales bacterium]
MTREDALEAIRENVENENLVKHMIATESIMKELAKHFGEDEEDWALAGLLHDIDVELTEGDMNSHGMLGSDLVREMGVKYEISQAILSHNEMLGVPRETMMDKALFCADPLTGLITAAALVRPDKKLAGVEVKSVRKRFKEKSFAAGASREGIACCSEIGLELEEFIEIGLKAMQKAADELGL